jgi:hypothetical protein
VSIIRDSANGLGNLLGFHSKRKIIIFISDDWGGVRIRSVAARDRLISFGLNMNGNRFDRYDTLESNSDMECLFDILMKHKDQNGKFPLITAACNVANPDFRKIKEAEFKNYYYETFTETLKQYPEHDKVFSLYRKGIDLNIFRPEYHGREHLQVKWWLDDLISNSKIVRKAFEEGYWYLDSRYLINRHHINLAAANAIFSPAESSRHEEIMVEGVKLFSDVFKYNPSLFIPPAQQYSQSLEKVIAGLGIKMIDVPRYRRIPKGYGRYKFKFHYLGQKSKMNLTYITRNVVFEPNMNEHSDGVDECLNGIQLAFRQRRPAIISNHRAAFVGGVDIKNRDKGLKALDRLFTEIKNKWPEVEYSSPGDLFNN